MEFRPHRLHQRLILFPPCFHEEHFLCFAARYARGALAVPDVHARVISSQVVAIKVRKLLGCLEVERQAAV